MNEVAEPRLNPMMVLRHELQQRLSEFAMALPPHIPAERFLRTVLTAVQKNPELLEVSRRSLLTSCMYAAQDGLMPDGREGAIIVRWGGKEGKSAQWQVMVTGIKKKARNSGEIANWQSHAVHANDDFDFALGDAPYIQHRPALSDRGPLIAAYSVCKLKSGELSLDVMGLEELHAIRDRYSDGWKAYTAGKIKSTPWASAEDEMSKKTVMRRHSKDLPMATDVETLLQRDDDPIEDTGPTLPPPRRQGALSARLEALGRQKEPEPAQGTNAVDPDTGEVQDGLRDSARLDTAADEAEAATTVSADETKAGALASPAVAPAEAPPGLSSVAIAFARGEQMCRDGYQRKAMPPEYRDDEHVAEADAWTDGWAKEFKAMKTKPVAP